MKPHGFSCLKGNLLLNIGPTAKGEFPKQAVKLLESVGEWMHANGESIYGCGSSSIAQPEWGRLTQKDNAIFAHIFDKSGYCLCVNGLESDKVDYGLYLDDYAQCPVGSFWNKGAFGNFVTIAINTANLKDPIDTVIKLVLKK